MLDADETVTAPPTHSLCDVVRVTPYLYGAPDHRHGYTAWFTSPVTLLYAHRVALPPLGRLTAFHDRNLPALVGFALPVESTVRTELEDVAERLWAHQATGAAVDLWSWTAPGGWVYSLIVDWQPMPLEDWPLATEDQAALLAAGFAQPSRARYAWPDPSPIPSPHDVDPDVHLVLSTEADEPPLPGLPRLAPLG